MSKLKIGMMSFAHGHGGGYLAMLARRSDVKIRVADVDAERGRRYAEQHGVPFVESYDELLAWKPDGVVVCSENARHRELVELGAAAGAYVLCEKPLATSMADGRAMIEACERAGVGLMTAFPIRFVQPLLAMEALVRKGDLGRIVAASGTNPGSNPGYGVPWFVDPALSGGGAVMDHTVHVADLLRWLLGSDAVEVYAQTTRLLHPQMGVETGGTVVVTFANGTVATIDCSWSRPKSYPAWGTVTLELVGENGVVSTDAFAQAINAYSDGPGREGPLAAARLAWGQGGDDVMVAEFLASIRERRAPAPSGEDGLRATEIAFGAYLSAQSGQPVRLPLEDFDAVEFSTARAAEVAATGG